MKCLLLLLMCCSSIPTVTSSIRVDGYLCVTPYWDSVTCFLNITGDPAQQPSYRLEFTDADGSKTFCPLAGINYTYSTVCKLAKNYLLSNDEFDIRLCHGSGCHPVTRNISFLPSQHIQLTPPLEAEFQQTPETLNITWKSGYEEHLFFASSLDYELLLHTTHSKDIILRPNSLKKRVSVQRSKLKRGAVYCAMVRSLPSNSDYEGTWSEWSPSACWRNGAAEEQNNTFITLTKSLVPVCVTVGVLLFVLYSPAARKRIKSLSQTPSPAPFFQPLFQQHEGNLQEWFSPKGKVVLTYKTEEILTSSAVIVGPKPVSKELEENQDCLKTFVAQLEFPQCQTSYVGLPELMKEAPPPFTALSPGDTSYTRLPSSVWGVGGQDVVVPSPPKGFFSISREDSGCEDPTQSPEFSLPSSPVDQRPPPHGCTDYCILNKTADGFVPALVGSGTSVPAVSLQADKS